MIDVVLIHGAGQSPNTWSALRELLTLSCRVKVIKLPGHGDDDDINTCLSMESMVESVRAHIENLSNTVIIGHSLGGSIATFFPSALSVIMIDICESTALRSLDTLPDLLSRLPSHFDSLEDAAIWYKRHNPSCKIPKISISGQLRQTLDNRYTWRVDLLRYRHLWRSWFEGMDRRFLSCSCPVLIMSNREWLDEELLIASMQGRFQFAVIPDSGHFLQEDQPEQLAQFIDRHIERLLSIVHHR